MTEFALMCGGETSAAAGDASEGTFGAWKEQARSDGLREQASEGCVSVER